MKYPLHWSSQTLSQSDDRDSALPAPSERIFHLLPKWNQREKWCEQSPKHRAAANTEIHGIVYTTLFQKGYVCEVLCVSDLQKTPDILAINPSVNSTIIQDLLCGSLTTGGKKK